jgi:hypothetical protein
MGRDYQGLGDKLTPKIPKGTVVVKIRPMNKMMAELLEHAYPPT